MSDDPATWQRKRAEKAEDERDVLRVRLTEAEGLLRRWNRYGILDSDDAGTLYGDTEAFLSRSTSSPQPEGRHDAERAYQAEGEMLWRHDRMRAALERIARPRTVEVPCDPTDETKFETLCELCACDPHDADCLIGIAASALGAGKGQGPEKSASPSPSTSMKPGQRCTLTSHPADVRHVCFADHERLWGDDTRPARRCPYIEPTPEPPTDKASAPLPADPVEALRNTPCPDGHGGRLGCISQGLASEVEQAGYFCASRIRAAHHTATSEPRGPAE